MSVPAFTNKGVITSPPDPTHPIQGIDLSHYEPTVDWSKLKAANIKFVFIKASEIEMDESFNTHWANAKANGIIRGAYHFFHPSIDPVVQAQLHANIIGKLDLDDLPSTVDLETDDQLLPAAVSSQLLIFLKELQTLTGKQPIIYGAPYFLQALNLDNAFADCPLWVAHYDTDVPMVPKPWPYWSFWQTTDQGKIDGLSMDMDMNLFNGNIDQLMKIAHGG